MDGPMMAQRMMSGGATGVGGMGRQQGAPPPVLPPPVVRSRFGPILTPEPRGPQTPLSTGQRAAPAGFVSLGQQRPQAPPAFAPGDLPPAQDFGAPNIPPSGFAPPSMGMGGMGMGGRPLGGYAAVPKPAGPAVPEPAPFVPLNVDQMRGGN